VGEQAEERRLSEDPENFRKTFVQMLKGARLPIQVQFPSLNAKSAKLAREKKEKGSFIYTYFIPLLGTRFGFHKYD
jgi:hypothetical protein